MPASVRVRRATAADADCAALLFDQYRQFYGQQSDVDVARTFLAERIKRRESVILLARESALPLHTPVGFVQLYPAFTSVSVGRLWILNDLFVTPSARRKGVAMALMAAAGRHARRTKAVRIELTTAHDNARARRLYETLGYLEEREFVTYRLGLDE